MAEETERPEWLKRQMSDPRWIEIPFVCIHCKHIISVGNQFEPAGWTCKAFPEEILYSILSRREHHTAPILSQVGDYVYDPEIYVEEDTGREWHYTADADWRYVNGDPKSPPELPSET